MQVFGLTDIGEKRETNQDTFFVKQLAEHATLAIVCDGMGGQNGGHIASDMACNTLSEYLITHNIALARGDAAKQLLVNAMSEANLCVYKASNMEPGCKGMGTTAVVAVVLGDTIHIVHIGDSRAYIQCDDKFYQVTRDHSVVQELFEQGKITKDAAKTHPDKNMITRAVGVNILVDIDYLEFEFPFGQKLLLCTDGLTNMLSDSTIDKVMRKYEQPKAACEKLIELSNKAGGYDNITVAIIGHTA